MKLIVWQGLWSYTFDASAQTITLTGLPTLTLDSLVLITNMTDNEIIYQFNSSSKWGSISGNVITLDYDTTSMSDADDLQIILSMIDIDTDYDLKAKRGLNINPEYAQYTDWVNLVTAQDLTASYADFGSEIDCRWYNRLGVWITYDVNDSENVKLKALAKYESAGSIEAEFTDNEETLWTTSASDGSMYIEFDIWTIPYIQLQWIAWTVGATAGDLTIVYNLKY